MKGSRSGASMYMFKPRLKPLPPDRHVLKATDRPRVRKLCHEKGATLAVVAAQLGLTPQTVGKYIRRMHIIPSWSAKGKPDYSNLSLRDELDEYDATEERSHD